MESLLHLLKNYTAWTGRAYALTEGFDTAKDDSVRLCEFSDLEEFAGTKWQPRQSIGA